jgi:ParB/RepB/Spo0J family partition protein
MTPNEQTDAQTNRQAGEAGLHNTTARAASIDSDGVYTTELDPELVHLDPALQQLREWTGSSRQERSIDELARMIAEEGQLLDATVRETDNGFVLVAGHRRREAIIRLRREGSVKDDGSPFLLKVKVVPSVDENRALRMALMENVQREDFTPVEFARAIVNVIRPRFGWTDKKTTAKVAGFLGVSPATVTQAEKLLKLPEGIQADVQAGRLSAAAALDYTPVLDAGAGPEKVAEVAEKARRKADAEAAKEADRAAKLADKLEKEAAEAKARSVPPSEQKGAPKDKKSQAVFKSDAARTAKIERKARLAREAADKAAGVVKEGKAKVKGRHVRAAVKESGAAGGKQKAPRMSEAVELFEGWTGALYPKVMASFAQAFMAWGKGKLTDKAITRAWDDVADAADAASSAKSGRPAEPGGFPTGKAVVKAAMKAAGKAARKSAKRIGPPATKRKAAKTKAKKVK